MLGPEFPMTKGLAWDKEEDWDYCGGELQNSRWSDTFDLVSQLQSFPYLLNSGSYASTFSNFRFYVLTYSCDSGNEHVDQILFGSKFSIQAKF